ncbi:hypothetical protein JCM10908_006437 [Rhodotorula pacifica]|uniref:GNAT family N-acetyltransferase n=1 Tax=Rhodotorula pacifica TaxID=1495444 RepID=UPI0031824DAC
MTGDRLAVTLYDHSASLSPLVNLLEPSLPLSLPLYSTLLTPGVPLSVYATLPPLTDRKATDTHTEEPWLVVADMGNQLRFFCSVEGEQHPSEERLAQAREMVASGLKKYLEGHHRGRDRISIGAIPDIWRSAIRDAFGVEPFSASEIHYRTLRDLPAITTNGSTTKDAHTSGDDEVITTAGRPEDIAEILSTSEVPHPPSYLETRLPYTTLLRSASPSSSLSSATSSSSESSSHPRTQPPSRAADDSPAPPRILAHCTTHRDGSIGTLHVSPLARRRGLGSRVFLARATLMRDTDPNTTDGKGEGSGYVYAYVHKENESSNALMRRCGMRKSGYEVWWARVKLPMSTRAVGSAGGA